MEHLLKYKSKELVRHSKTQPLISICMHLNTNTKIHTYINRYVHKARFGGFSDNDFNNKVIKLKALQDKKKSKKCNLGCPV